MKTPCIAVVGGRILLGVPGRTFEITDEDLARLRMQSGDALLLRARYQAQKQAKKEAAAVAEV